METATSKLFYEPKNVYDTMTPEDRERMEAHSAGFLKYLSRSKTERLANKYTIELAKTNGFKPYTPDMRIQPGDKIYVDNRGKAVFLAIIGQKPLAAGARISAAHLDSPRLDLKQMPLYEDDGMAYLKTHYYGGIKKYQWLAMPLALYGIAVTQSGETVDVAIGDRPEDPLFTITDLLPHLSADQNKKTMAEGVTGENLNVLFGSEPVEGEEKDRVKLHVLTILNEKYGMVEEDFLCAEFEIVPAFDARELGLDRSLIGGYGQDDRVCAYASIQALFELEGVPDRTCICMLADKEEIGSEGVTGMKSAFFERVMLDLCRAQDVLITHCYDHSFCLSADVTNGFDPNYPDVSEKRNNTRMNFGMALTKYHGSRGKSGSNDANAETLGKLRGLLNEAKIPWQTGELGKVDQGGGGTVAIFMSGRNIETIDAGVPILSMHAPYEVSAKADGYCLKEGIRVIFEKY